jgi:hypothetical protein
MPVGGSIDPYSNATVDIHLDAAELEDGEYLGSVYVASNDPDSPSHGISVTLNVGSILCGDIDGSAEGPDIGDLVYLVDYMFNGGPPPPDMAAANIDGEPGINISDLVYLVDFMFNGGPLPICQ